MKDVRDKPKDEVYIQHLRERFGLKFIDINKKPKSELKWRKNREDGDTQTGTMSEAIPIREN